MIKSTAVCWKFTIVFVFFLNVSGGFQSVKAEENGTGAYAPGIISSFMDGMLPKPGFLIRPNFYRYNGKLGLPCLQGNCSISGLSKLRSRSYSLTLGWRPDVDLGADFSYMMSASTPYVFLDVSLDVRSNASGALLSREEQSVEGIGDTELIPFNLSYHLTPKADINAKFIIRAPTGKFDVNKIANIGKNYWSYEPTISYLYNDQENLFSNALYLGVNFNDTNPDTDYHSGTTAHLEFTTQKSYIYAQGLLGIGATGYYYHQISDDGGRGAVYGANKAKLASIGPVVSYTKKLNENTLGIAELKWTHDFYGENRFEGDTVILKAALVF